LNDEDRKYLLVGGKKDSECQPCHACQNPSHNYNTIPSTKQQEFGQFQGALSEGYLNPRWKN
jgi:hypothetical protein